MRIINQVLEIQTTKTIEIQDLTPQLQQILDTTAAQNGQMLVFSRHTTTALVINEREERLWEDVKTFLRKLAPPFERYLHNDLHLRSDIPEDEPENAHAHLMAMLLSTSEVIPIVEGKLSLGTYQAILFLELDGPRQRTITCQIMSL